MNSYRTFLAIDLPDNIRDTLEALSEECRTGRAVDWDDLHLTLHFLGDQPVDLLEEAHENLSARPLPAPDLEFDGLGGFGTPARSVAALIRPNDTLNALHKTTASALRQSGITLEHRRFRPHVTLLRIPRNQPPQDQAKLHSFLTTYAGKSLPPFTPDSMTLYRSILRPEGPIYDPLVSYDLGT